MSVSVPGFYYNNTASAFTFSPVAITSGTIGIRYCFGNAVTRNSAVTIQMPASTYLINAGAVASSAGTFVSAGALGDAACIVAVDTMHFQAYIGSGTWTNN